ncbi:hypothetical protein B0T25DRAFT_278032 [Lasiosphaeria hispida]|uniref:SET domain-containing protein n=1 Tax=Lasiosphaeria hispida TaxID=260671 RepID=A0AAJ0HBX5_9PEZI|nr:hypothetical protein B0T25DRAFT_278032 [Lasiosphaeria hispida]
MHTLTLASILLLSAALTGLITGANATTGHPSHSIASSPFTCPAHFNSQFHCPAYNPQSSVTKRIKPSSSHTAQSLEPSPEVQPEPEASQEPQEPPRPASPWSRSPVCRRVGLNEFCAFTHSAFSAGQGISLITTPAKMLLLGSQPPLNESFSSTSSDSAAAAKEEAPLFQDIPIPGKGIGLVATQMIRAGRRVMAATPAVMVDDKAFRGLRREDLAILLGQAIVALPGEHRARFLNLSGSAVEETQLEKVYKIFSTNAFRTTVFGVGLGVDGKEGDKETDFQSTFTEVSRLNHDCSPNLGYYFDSATLSHKVYAVKDIFPGEELTVSYVDVLHPSSTRTTLLHKTWSFTCTCARCTAEPHLLAESDARVAQINQLRRELDDYSASATPEKAELLVTLYELEGVAVRIYEAYYRAALEWNGVGDAARATRYARLCLARGLVLRGPERPFVESMRGLVADPAGHWSWRFRVKDGLKREAEEGRK